MPSKKKKYNARFPAGRIKKIMQTDEEVGKVAQAVPVIISRTLELFVESLLSKSLQVTQSRNAKTLSPSHLKQCILAEARFDFLRDLVKNIPDISPSEEKDEGQRWTAENCGDCPYSEQRRQRSTQTSTASRSGSVHSSDSGSEDCEPPYKRSRPPQGNGRNYTTRHRDVQETPRLSLEIDAVTTVDPIIRVQHQPQIPVPLSTSVRQSRLPNFYQETLKEEIEESSDSVGSSVIQPNPAYSGSDSYQRKPEENISVDSQRLSVGVNLTTKSSPSTRPAFHLDLSKASLNRTRDSPGLPYTPTLIRQPQTPTLDGSHQMRTSPLHQFGTKKGPPPLQTLMRSASQPQIRIDVTTDGATPKIHLDLSNFDFGGAEAGASTPTLKKRKSNASMEPPALLPIVTTPTLKIPAPAPPSTVKMAPGLQLDEDYDT